MNERNKERKGERKKERKKEMGSVRFHRSCGARDLDDEGRDAYYYARQNKANESGIVMYLINLGVPERKK